MQIRFMMLTGAMLAAMPVAAQAQDRADGSGPYVGLSVGLNKPETSHDRGAFTSTVPATADYPAIPAGTPLTLDTKFNTGWAASGTAGYRFTNGFRIEAELAYSHAGVDTHRNLAAGGTVIDGLGVSVLTRGPATAGEPTVGTVIADGADGRVNTLAGFVNGFYDFNRGGTVQPYVGGGIGVERVSVKYAPSGVGVSRGNDTNFAWQLIGGATFRASDHLELFAQYNYRRSDRANVPLQLVPASWGVQSKQSIVSVGLRVPFGK